MSITFNSKTWITDNWSVLSTKQLNEVYLAGSHNSAAYTVSFDRNSTFYQSLEEPFYSLGYFPDIVNNWTQCQNLTVLDQLNSGIRVLDLRISQIVGSGALICSHTYYLESLTDILQQVKNFLTSSGGSQEFVIITYKPDQAFNNSSEIIYEALVSFFGSLISSLQGPHIDTLNSYTLFQLFQYTARILLIDATKTTNGFVNTWYNTQTIGDFVNSFNNDSTTGAPNTVYILDTVITPSSASISNFIGIGSGIGIGMYLVILIFSLLIYYWFIKSRSF